MPPVPSLQALIICEKIIEEARTKNRSLINIFTRVLSPQVPVQIASLALYARLTDAEGEYVFRVDVVALSDDKRIAQIVSRPVSLVDRLRGMEIALPFPREMVFQVYGKYEFQLYANDVFLGHASINIAPLGPEPENNG